jgi:RNA polymerase sigma-70 factor, ECF subfamily
MPSPQSQELIDHYRLRADDGAHHAWEVAVLDLDPGGISRIVVFGGPGLVGRFGLPPVHPG